MSFNSGFNYPISSYYWNRSHNYSSCLNYRIVLFDDAAVCPNDKQCCPGQTSIKGETALRHCQDKVVVALMFYVHGKILRSCREGQLT